MSTAGAELLGQLPRYAWWTLIGGILFLVVGLGSGLWLPALAGLAALGTFGWFVRSALGKPDEREPFPWPSDLRAAAEGMARPVDPEPKRLLPPDEKAATIAKIAPTKAALDRLFVDRPPLWRWAAFTSVVVQRRNSVQPRLRTCALGYQPKPGTPLAGRQYSAIAVDAMQDVADLVTQLEQFMLSPGFTGALKSFSEADGAEPAAILHIANRLMDYHESFLTEAERCLQTPVETDVIVFVQDMGAFTMCPLAGYEQFIQTMCSRFAEGQEIVPYADDTVQLDDVNLAIRLPDGLSERIQAHIRRYRP
jgi:hypothetical protein